VLIAPLAVGIILTMSTTEVLDEILKLSSDERWEIRLKLAEVDGDGWLDDDNPLTTDQKAL
jgi:hypothetical protein